MTRHQQVELSSGAMIQLRCRKCERVIAQSLRVLSHEASVTFESGEPVVPCGYVVSSDRLLQEPDFDAILRNITNGVIANRNDLHDVLEGGDRQGCCGPSGNHGPNLFCKSGHPFGAEYGDCWMPNCVFLSSEFVEVLNA